jgi:hypothetical protein
MGRDRAFSPGVKGKLLVMAMSVLPLEPDLPIPGAVRSSMGKSIVRKLFG